ncbi:MAG: 6,7-dimethyl-8-ribityllumazine synthase, partial [Candidatus Rokuibacteriota bacterium]
MTRQTKIAYVQAAWHTDITDRCKQAFVAELARHGYDQSGIEFFSAPGSLEIPLMAKKLAKTGKYAAVCASGFVVDGGIYRHEFVAQAVLQGIV